MKFLAFSTLKIFPEGFGRDTVDITCARSITVQ